MTLEVPSNLQYALLEFIAHLNVEDYDAVLLGTGGGGEQPSVKDRTPRPTPKQVPQDFINLGFSPEGVSAERLKASGITDGLSFAFRQLSAGGGPKKIAERVEGELKQRYGAELSGPELEKKAQAELLAAMEAQLASEGVDVKGVTNVMEEVSRRNRELFALPPYVLYVARAFSTLEGIGLSVDEDYAIVQECYPYLARRLFTDRSPRSKAALRAMLGLDSPAVRAPSVLPFGADTVGVVVPTAQSSARGNDGGDGGGGGLSPSKLVEMSEQFREATAATATVDRGAGVAEATRELAGLLIDPEGSTLQDILVEESARLGDAAVRQALRTALVDTPASLVAPLGLKPPPALEALLAATDEDQRALATASEIVELIGPRVRKELGAAASEPPPPTAVAEAVGSLLADGGARGDVWRGVQGVTTLSRRIGELMLRRAVQRAEGTPGLPAAAREAIINGNKAVADAIEPAGFPADGGV